MWSGKGWKRITAVEAARIHPGGTVAARSGLFMCELCGQYVTLTDGNYQVRHFRHSSNEKSKNCPDRIEARVYRTIFIAGEHELPLRIIVSKSMHFSFEIGFIRVPRTILSKKLTITIHTSDLNKELVYLRERINPDQVSYLSAGDAPTRKYSITVSGADKDIYQYWPKEIAGIDPDGTLFEKTSGRKLVDDSDVVIDKTYYLVKRGRLIVNSRHITARELARKKTNSWQEWILYEIQAKDYDEYTAKFFLELHYRLTLDPVTINYIWPIYAESPYVIKHNRPKLVALISGNAKTQIFPTAKIRKYECSAGEVVEIECNNRQQMITAGRLQPLQYTYYWKETLNSVTEQPVAAVKDLEGNEVISGMHSELPRKGILNVLLPYDGSAVIKEKGAIAEKRFIAANTSIDIEVTWENEISIYVGTDCLWNAWFERAVLVKDDLDFSLSEKIISMGGPLIKCPHNLKNILGHVKNEKLEKWIRYCLRNGYIREKAYRELQSYFIKNSINSKF